MCPVSESSAQFCGAGAAIDPQERSSWEPRDLEEGMAKLALNLSCRQLESGFIILLPRLISLLLPGSQPLLATCYLCPKPLTYDNSVQRELRAPLRVAPTPWFLRVWGTHKLLQSTWPWWLWFLLPLRLHWPFVLKRFWVWSVGSWAVQ